MRATDPRLVVRAALLPRPAPQRELLTTIIEEGDFEVVGTVSQSVRMRRRRQQWNQPRVRWRTCTCARVHVLLLSPQPHAAHSFAPRALSRLRHYSHAHSTSTSRCVSVCFACTRARALLAQAKQGLLKCVYDTIVFSAPNDSTSPSARAVNDVKAHFEKLVDDSGEVVFATLGELNPEYLSIPKL